MPRPIDLHEGIEIGLRLLQPRLTERVRVHRDYGAVPVGCLCSSQRKVASSP